MDSNSVLLTGSTGFVGSSLLKQLQSAGVPIRLLSRHPSAVDNCFVFNDDYSAEIFSAACSGVDTVIHLAAKAHQANVSAETFHQVNTELTIALATAAAKQKVRRFIFLSSIGVNGVRNNAPFTAQSPALPTEEYAISKFRAEQALQKIAAESGMEVVIIRSPLVYGPKAPGNFGKLMTLSRLKIPLPLGAIHNKRSFVFLDNLIDLMIHCISHPQAASKTFLVSDDDDVSTTGLFCAMIRAQGRQPMLIPMPVSLLKFLAQLAGKKFLIERLCDDLTVDMSYTKQVLGWTPPFSFKDAIHRCFENGQYE